MVAIFVGEGAGLARSSANILGGAGQLGSALLGRAGEGVSVNAATGSLVVTQQDEFLAGRGLDASVARTYNSLGQTGDRDNGDNWQLSSTRRIFGLTGTLNTAGSTIKRLDADGSVITYSWGTKNGVAAYWTTDGAGTYDRLEKSGSEWIWTDGDSKLSERYETSHGDPTEYRLKYFTDIDGYSVKYTYVAGSDRLHRITTATNPTNSEWLEYSWNGDNLASIRTGYTDLATNTAQTLTTTRYAYDSQDRLIEVKTDLSPEDEVITDGNVYTVTYTYHNTSNRIASITQSDGSSLAIGYDGQGRVTSLTQTVAVGDTRVTNLTYGTNHAIVTAPDGTQTRLDYEPSAVSSTSEFVPTEYAPTALNDWLIHSSTQITDTGTTVDGHTVYRYSANVGMTTGSIYPAKTYAAPGETYSYEVSLKAESATSPDPKFVFWNDFGGAVNMSGAILEGPGQLVQQSPGSTVWILTGLSTTEATRIKVSRTFDAGSSGGQMQFYFQNVYGTGGYAAGDDILAYNSTFYREGQAAGDPLHNRINPSLDDWYGLSTTNVDDTGTTVDGHTVYKIYSDPGATQSRIYTTGLYAETGKTYHFEVSLRAGPDASPTERINLHTSNGGVIDANAIILDGPGQIAQHGSTGRQWSITGLSSTEATRIRFTRTMGSSEAGENMSPYLYVDYPGGYAAGQEIFAHNVLFYEDVTVDEAATTGGRLLQITAPPAEAGGLHQVVQFEYDADGNLIRSIETEQASGASQSGGANLIDVSGWPGDPTNPPSGSVDVTGWLNSSPYTDDGQWVATTGRDGQQIVAMHTGQLDADIQGGGNHTNTLPVDPTKAHEFSYYLKMDQLGQHMYRLGTTSNRATLAGDSGSESGLFVNEELFTAADGFEVDKWYKVVGYILPQGTAADPTADIGGIYDVDTGAKLRGVDHLRWNTASNANFNTVRSAFYSWHMTGNQGLYNYFDKPEVKEVDSAAILSGNTNLYGNQSVTYDENGRITTYTYDARGNVLQTTEPNGDYTYKYYDANDRLVRELSFSSSGSAADVGRYHRYAYDAEGHLTFAIDPEGRVTEYEYDPVGQVTRILEYTDHHYVVNQVAPSHADMVAWRDNPAHDRSSVMTTYNIYDARGNLKEMRTHGVANADGSTNYTDIETRSYYTYDQEGRLLSRHGSGENAETFTYDGMGRLVASTDLDGGTTSIVFDDANSKTVTQPLELQPL